MTDISVKTGGFTPEIFSNKLNINLDNYGAYNDIVNRKYEGEIKQKGDKVHFFTLGSFTVRDYEPNATGFTGLTFDDPTGVKQTLEVDQEEYIAYKVPDVQEIQSDINIANEYVKRMTIAFGNKRDTYIHGLAVAGAGTKLNSSTAVTLTKDNIWAEVCKIQSILGRKNALGKDLRDHSGKRPALVVTPEVYGMLLQCPQFFANAFGNEVLRKGQIGYLGAFDVFQDTNIEVTRTGTGADAKNTQTIIALTSEAITFAEQITKTEFARAEKDFADLVKALRVYGGLVANADCIVSDKVAVAA